MRPVTAATVALLILVAIAHALRLLFAVPVTVAGAAIPMWVSAVGTLVPSALAIGIWRERLSPPRPAV